MTAIAQRDKTFRIELLLENEESFSDDLVAFGHNVGPRIGPFKRTQFEIEDYCVRRLLIGWRKAGRLLFPVTVRGTDQTSPDYLIAMGTEAKVIGMEVTAAGREGWNKWLSDSAESHEEVHFFPSDGYMGERPEEMVAEDILQALEKKSSRWNDKRLLQADTYELLIYQNSEGGLLASRSRVVELVRAKIAQRGGVHPFAKLHIIYEPWVVLNVGANDEQSCDIGQDYDHDIVSWLEGQAAAIRADRTDLLDLPQIAEELESMGASDRRALASHIRNLILHLLKWDHQGERRSKSWERSVAAARVEIVDLFDDSPSLAAPKNLHQVIARQYPHARRLAAKEMGIDESRLPPECPFTVKQILDIDFPMPGARRKAKSRGDD